MSLREFLDYNKLCPKCGKELSLYMGSSNFCVKGVKSDNGYLFDKNSNCCDILTIENDGINIDIVGELNPQDLYFKKMFFFYVCNENAIKKETWDYSVNLYDACYYRASNYFRISNENEKNIMKRHENEKDLINHQESFAISTMKNDIENVYFVSVKYAEEKTKFWYYTVNEEQAKDEYYSPEVFEKEFPLMANKLDLSNKEKLIEKFDSWILMS